MSPHIENAIPPEFFDRSRLLKAFIDPNVINDPSCFTEYHAAYEASGVELKAAFGDEYENVGIIPLLQVGDALKIFNSQANFETKITYVNILTGIGFQLGNEEDCGAIFPKVFHTIMEVPVLNPETAASNPDIIIGYFWGVLSSGAYWKHCHNFNQTDKTIPTKND